MKDCCNSILKDVENIISKWHDTSITDGKISLMIANGGYIHKPSLLKKIKNLKEKA